jgi:cyclopropane-fatty-acyl-phospholipid synthase
MSDKNTVTSLLDLAGITIDGKEPSDIRILDDRFYKKVLHQRELGLGESYMNGWWTSESIDELVSKVLSADLLSKVKVTPALAKAFLISTVLNKQTKTRAKRNASFHYNIGNDLYERMLDSRMVYSCAYFKDAKNLDDAQEAKLDLICRKLHLKKGMTLLDIGCGWGGFSIYAAKNYGVKVTGISPAAEQVKIAKDRSRGLDIVIQQKDYREIEGIYDRIVSIGMLEHVGSKNYKNFFKICKDHLADNGLMLHHTIGNNKSTNAADPWITKYIFPGGVIPSLAQITKAVEKRLVIEDIQNIEIKDKYDERFYRMWNYYLLSAAGGFRARHIQLWQIVFKKINHSSTYIAAR